MRALLAGKGYPIPGIALPDPNLDGDFPNQILILEDGVPFEKAEWVGLGYTHYEAFCVGGSGGRGGPAAASLVWNQRIDPSIRIPFTFDEWATIVNGWAATKPPYGSGGHYIPSGHWIDDSWFMREAPAPGSPGAPISGTFLGNLRANHYDASTNPPRVWFEYNPWWVFNAYQYAEFLNPTHSYIPTLFHDPYLYGLVATGGGGGGGGFFTTTDELDNLPDSVPVVVGKAGADAPFGLSTPTPTNGVKPKRPDVYTYSSSSIVPPNTQMAFTDTYPPNSVYPDAPPVWSLPEPGQDGEPSSFNDSMCQASGGKGGGPAAIFNGSAIEYTGFGGDGGLGGRVIAGGGGKGSTSRGNGLDGSWNGQVGGGGGGGRGSHPSSGLAATDGGRGVFSYTDTSIYGGRHTKIFVQPPPALEYYTTREPPFYEFRQVPILIPPQFGGGTGGGVRVLRKMKYGSDAKGYSQDGAVILRISKRD